MDPLDQSNPDLSTAPTIGDDGRRRWLYPDRRVGDKSKQRQRIAIVLIVFYLIAPFCTLNGLPLMRVDVLSGKVSFWGQTFRFHDASYTFFFFVLSALSLLIVTAVRGRVWCGYACPQTVWIDWVVRPIEELIEGNAARRQVTDKTGRGVKKWLRKTIKHLLFLGLASFLSHILLSYFVEPAILIGWLTYSPTDHWEAFLVVLVVTGLIYFDFAWFREQFCAFLCPYARFQSVMMDEHTPVVAYDYQRGEPRGKRKDGDCIDCQLCVRVCPTGIDIRKGLQLECIQCSRCVDACNIIMKSLKRPPNLIREFSAEAYKNKQKDSMISKFRQPKNALFLLLFCLFFSLFLFRLTQRDDVEVLLTRQTGTTYSQMDQGNYANLFHLNVVNITAREQIVQLKSLTPGLKLICSGCDQPLLPFEEKEFSLVVLTKNTHLSKGQVEIVPTGEKLSIPLILPKKH